MLTKVFVLGTCSLVGFAGNFHSLFVSIKLSPTLCRQWQHVRLNIL